MSNSSAIGCHGRVTGAGAIRPGRTGEVMVAIGGGVQDYLARVDGGAIDAFEESVVVEQVAPRTVPVARLYEKSIPELPEEIPES